MAGFTKDSFDSVLRFQDRCLMISVAISIHKLAEFETRNSNEILWLTFHPWSLLIVVFVSGRLLVYPWYLFFDWDWNSFYPYLASRSRHDFDLSLALWVTNSRKLCMYLLRHLAPLCSDFKLWKLDNISSFSSLENDVGEDILFEMWSIDTEGTMYTMYNVLVYMYI